MQAFAKLNEGRLYKLLKTCMDIQTDLKGLVKSYVCLPLSPRPPEYSPDTQSEFLRRLEQSSAILVTTMSTFLRRATLHIVNPSSIPTFVKRMQKGFEPSAVAYSQTQTQTLGQTFSMFSAGAGEPEGRAQHAAHSAQLWMAYVSKHCPTLYKAHVGEFTKAIADERNARLVEACLHALAAAAAADAKLAPSDKCVFCFDVVFCVRVGC